MSSKITSFFHSNYKKIWSYSTHLYIVKKPTVQFLVLLLCFLVYFFLPIIFVFTFQVFNFRNELFYSGDASFMAFHAFTLKHDFSSNFLGESKSIGYPDRYFFTYDSSLTFSILFIFLSYLVKNWVFSYNFQVIFFIGLSGLGGYLFAKKVFNNSIITAFCSGLFYSFNSITLHLYWSVSLLSAYSFIPFFYLYYLSVINSKNQTEQSIFKDKNIFLAVFFCVLLGISSLQIWFFSIIVSGFIFIIWSSQNSLKRWLKATQKPAFIYLITIFLLSPILVYQGFFSQRYVINRDIENLFSNSIHIRSIDIKKFFSPYCGSYVNAFLTSPGTSLECSSGESFWLGSSPIFITLLFLVTLKRKELSKYWKSPFSRKIILTLLFIFFISLGPLLQIGESFLPLPYYWLYRFFPAFDAVRVPARFMFFFELFYAVLLAMLLTKVGEKCKKYKLLFYAFVLLFFVIENSYSYQQIGYKKITSLDEKVWQELAQPRYGLFLKYPIPWFSGEGQKNPDDTQELWEYMIHRKPTIWAYPGLLSHASVDLMENFLGNFLTTPKLKELSALGVKNIVVDKSKINGILSVPPELSLQYEDERYQIFQIPTYSEERLPFTHLNSTCSLEPPTTLLETYNKNWNVLIHLSNSNPQPIVQTKPQILIHYQINGQTKVQTSWLQLPFLIPARESRPALLVIRKDFLTNSLITHLSVQSLDPDIPLDFKCRL